VQPGHWPRALINNNNNYTLLIGEQLPLFGKIAMSSSSLSNNPRKVLKSEVFGLLHREGEGNMIISNLVF
jgi:hypothetical protein